jgi:hypothetical protein
MPDSVDRVKRPGRAALTHARQRRLTRQPSPGKHHNHSGAAPHPPVDNPPPFIQTMGGIARHQSADARSRMGEAGAPERSRCVALEGGALVHSRDRLQQKVRGAGRCYVFRGPADHVPRCPASPRDPARGRARVLTSSGYSDQEKVVEKPLLPSAE